MGKHGIKDCHSKIRKKDVGASRTSSGNVQLIMMKYVIAWFNKDLTAENPFWPILIFEFAKCNDTHGKIFVSAADFVTMERDG